VLLQPVNHIILPEDKRDWGSLTTFLPALANWQAHPDKWFRNSWDL